MKARRVKKLDPESSLADNAERIVRVRLGELCSFAPAAVRPSERETLHDMRIAAKRLRYVLELTSPCFGPYAAQAAKHARDLQDVIGEIHDCDVMIPLILEHIARLRQRDAQDLIRGVDASNAVDPTAADRAPHRSAYRPLELLVVQQQARRALCFEQFVQRLTALERSGFRKRLEKAISERPEAPAPAAADPPATESSAAERAEPISPATEPAASDAILEQAVA